MKKWLIIILTLILVVLLSSCVHFGTEKIVETLPQDSSAVIESTATLPYTTLPLATENLSGREDSGTEGEAETEPTALLTSMEAGSEHSEETSAATAPESTETTTILSDDPQQTTTEPVTQAPPVTQPVPSVTEATTMELNIELPEANGTMLVDKSSSNRFIVSVVEKRKLDSSLLVAVYSLPESGQNYVFEFKSKTGRDPSELRRVYLLDGNGTITSVAAEKNSEKEVLNATENWFCFNVLIKGVIFKAIADKF